MRMAGWIGLVALLWLSSGCGDSHPKQDADHQATQGSGAAPAVNQPSPEKAEARLAEESVATSPPDELGFKHTWKPRSTAAAANSAAPVRDSVSAQTILPGVIQSGTASADEPVAGTHREPTESRYVASTPVPAVGNHVETPALPTASKPAVGPVEPDKTLSAASGPQFDPDPVNAQPKTAGPAKIEPAKVGPAKVEPVRPDALASEDPPAGNPLRDPGAAPLSGRPEAPPQPDTPSEPVIETPVKPTPAILPPQPAQKSELAIKIKPDETTDPKTPVAPAPVVPVAPAAEKKTQPKEHSAEPAATGPRTAKNSGVPFDPIAVNGKIFENWPKPKLALVITGNQEGYLEPCGCAGLERMKGGMSRRFSLFAQLAKDGWSVVGIDVGNIAKGFGKQAELKFQIAINAMSGMHYNAATLGATDLHLPTDEVMALTMPANDKEKTMFVCGNVGLFKFNELLLPRTQLIHAGFKTIGLTAVLGKTDMAKLAGNNNLVMIDPEKLLDEALPLLKKAKANYLILLAQTTRAEAIALAKKYPDFDLVVCSDGNAEPPNRAEEIVKNGTKLIEVGEKGMYAVVLGLYDDPQRPMRYQRVTLDSRFPPSPEMVALMSAYQDQLKDLGLKGLGIRPLDHPLKKFNGDFTGTDSCMKCHEESYKVWKKSAHSHAFATLQKAEPPRDFDPECISCHVVGWNPTKFFPYKSGYLSQEETPKLTNVGCEDCHGPGQMHVWAENHGTKAQQLAARKTVVITKEEAASPRSPKQNCWSCHDLDNSPEFNFQLYWPFVKHSEHE